jgi:hypothetical protein
VDNLGSAGGKLPNLLGFPFQQEGPLLLRLAVIGGLLVEATPEDLLRSEDQRRLLRRFLTDEGEEP